MQYNSFPVQHIKDDTPSSKVSIADFKEALKWNTPHDRLWHGPLHVLSNDLNQIG